MDYYSKYIKYKIKYSNLKQKIQKGGIIPIVTASTTVPTARQPVPNTPYISTDLYDSLAEFDKKSYNSFNKIITQGELLLLENTLTKEQKNEIYDLITLYYNIRKSCIHCDNLLYKIKHKAKIIINKLEEKVDNPSKKYEEVTI